MSIKTVAQYQKKKKEINSRRLRALEVGKGPTFQKVSPLNKQNIQKYVDILFIAIICRFKKNDYFS